MTSPKKADAARANGAKSRGPNTKEGKARSSRNSMKLGLSLPILLCPSDHRLHEDLMNLLGMGGDDSGIRLAADAAAHTLLNLRMVRQAKRVAMQQASSKFDQPKAFNNAIRLAASCVRYEGRAFSKWKKAARRLNEAHLKLTERPKKGRRSAKAEPM